MDNNTTEASVADTNATPATEVKATESNATEGDATVDITVESVTQDGVTVEDITIEAKMPDGTTATEEIITESITPDPSLIDTSAMGFMDEIKFKLHSITPEMVINYTIENYLIICAVIGILATVILLIRKAETKTVLMGVGFILCLISLKPMEALTSYATTMTHSSLIKAICSAMGFAFAMKVTACDKHLVKLLTAPLKNIGFFLIPVTFVITFFISIPLTSAAGCAAAVGATMIPLLLASGIRPAMAAASVFAGTMGGILSPGTSHNPMVAEMSGKTVPDIIAVHIPTMLTSGIIMLISLIVVAIICGDYKKGAIYQAEGGHTAQDTTKVNVLFALMPLVPLILILIGTTSLSQDFKFLNWAHNIGVAEAMLLGAIIAIVVTRTKPDTVCKEFFNGMGSAFANIIGIIIAASVFVAGLKACGLIDLAIEWLKNEQDYVRYGGTFIPFLMAVITGSGDAAAIAFNGAVTIHAETLGFGKPELGSAVAISGVLGRGMSPIAGACIIVATMAGVSTFDVVKRTALGCLISVCVIAFVIL